jgi:hypothetical protein
MSEECNSQAVVAQLETIVTLKNLRKKVEEGKVGFVSVDVINAEIETQRKQMGVTIEQCGGLENIPVEDIPDQVIEELAEASALAELEPVNLEELAGPEPDLTESMVV